MANITRIDPFDDLFRGFFVRPVDFKGAPAQTPSIKMDVQEQGDSYLVHAELEDESRVWLYEHWASEEALHEHDQTAIDPVAPGASRDERRN